MTKNYYPVGTYQVVHYDKHDEVIKKELCDGSSVDAKKIADATTAHSAKVFRAIYDTKYNAWSPKHG